MGVIAPRLDVLELVNCNFNVNWNTSEMRDLYYRTNNDILKLNMSMNQLQSLHGAGEMVSINNQGIITLISCPFMVRQSWPLSYPISVADVMA